LKMAPHLGHGQKRLTMGPTNFNNKTYMDTEWRFAFHDILDNDLGYPPKTKLEVMKGVIRSDGHELQLRDFSFIDVMLLGKWDAFNKAASWKVKMGHWQTRWGDRELSTQGVQGGYGYSYELWKFTPYLLAHIETSYISEELNKVKLAYGGDLGVLFDISEEWKHTSVFEGRVYPWNESRFSNELRYSNKSFGVGGFYNVHLKDGAEEFGLRFLKYL
jgi:hypothetical protein